MVKQVKQQKRLLKPVPLGIGLLLLACIVVLALELTNTTYFFHSRPAKSGPIPTISKSKPANTAPSQYKSGGANVGNSGSVSDKSSGSGTTTSNSGTGQPPVTPFGTFVSNHMPGQNGTDLKEQSTCNSTPGATCSITITKDGVVKTLPAQTLDSSGAAYWTWDVGKAGLTSGSWKVTATATLNGQTAQASDGIPLEVQ